jgi:hypothetical protein
MSRTVALALPSPRLQTRAVPSSAAEARRSGAAGSAPGAKASART